MMVEQQPSLKNTHRRALLNAFCNSPLTKNKSYVDVTLSANMESETQFEDVVR
jgi:hypothetical protein